MNSIWNKLKKFEWINQQTQIQYGILIYDIVFFSRSQSGG